jgi:mandelate racemase
VVVQSFRTHRVSLPLPRRYISGIHDYSTTENVLLELDVGDAIGIGHAFAFLPRQADAIRTIVVDLAETLVGQPVDRVRAVWTELWSRINFVGQSGVTVMALATIDTALWDLLAQRAGMPLYRMLGAVRSALPVYASGGWFTYSKEELVEEALAFAERGYAGYKIKIGRADWREDLDRIEYVLERVGDAIPLMVDANQAYSVEKAIAVGRELGSLGITWYEEPVVVQDVDGSARVTAAVDVQLATGETVFTRHGFQPWIDKRAADVLMPNVVRCGGPSQFLHVASLADAHRIPVSSHTYTEVSAHLMAACPNAGMVEYIPGWWDELFEDPPPIDAGVVQLADRPGLGFTFAEKALREYSTETAAAVGNR